MALPSNTTGVPLKMFSRRILTRPLGCATVNNCFHTFLGNSRLGTVLAQERRDPLQTVLVRLNYIEPGELLATVCQPPPRPHRPGRNLEPQSRFPEARQS
jgi:hypothetical protein